MRNPDLWHHLEPSSTQSITDLPLASAVTHLAPSSLAEATNKITQHRQINGLQGRHLTCGERRLNNRDPDGSPVSYRVLAALAAGRSAASSAPRSSSAGIWRGR